MQTRERNCYAQAEPWSSQAQPHVKIAESLRAKDSPDPDLSRYRLCDKG